MSGLPRDLVLGSEGSGTITPYEVLLPTQCIMKNPSKQAARSLLIIAYQ